jgi:hypothetical protein
MSIESAAAEQMSTVEDSAPVPKDNQEDLLLTKAMSMWLQNPYAMPISQQATISDAMVFTTAPMDPSVNATRQDLLYLCLYSQPFQVNRRGDDP